MFEEEEEPTGIGYAIQVLAGLLVGLFGSLVVMALASAVLLGTLGNIGGRAWPWVAEILDIALLGAVGYWIFRRMDRSAMSRGILLGMSIAFLLNAICGVGALTS